MNIPVAAIKKVERVQFDLPINRKEKDKLAVFTLNEFEVFLKDDFIDIFLRPDYEQRASCNHSTHKHNGESSPQRVSNFGSNMQSSTINQDRTLSTPGKSMI